MTDIAADPVIRRDFAALAEAAAVVGVGPDPEPGDARREPVQRLARGGHGAGAAGPRRGRRRRRAGGDAADPARRLLRPVRGHDAGQRRAGRRAIELPLAAGRVGSTHVRRTRRRGHDLASVTLACAVAARGHARSRSAASGRGRVVVTDASGRSPTRRADGGAAGARSTRCSPTPRPSATSMRASPEYRLAMLRVLGLRAVEPRTGASRSRAA